MAYSLFKAIWATDELKSSEKHTLIRMCYVGKDEDDFITSIYISNERLAADLGCTTRTVINTTENLIKKGFLINDKHHSKAKNHYEIPKARFKALVDNLDKDIHRSENISHDECKNFTPMSENISHKQSNTALIYQKTITLLEGQRLPDANPLPSIQDFVVPVGFNKPDFVSSVGYVGDGTIDLEQVSNKIATMRRFNDIQGDAFYLPDQELIEGAMYHISHRHLTKTESDLHAFRGACKLMREGRWKTPKGLEKERVEAANKKIADENKKAYEEQDRVAYVQMMRKDFFISKHPELYPEFFPELATPLTEEGTLKRKEHAKSLLESMRASLYSPTKVEDKLNHKNTGQQQLEDLKSMFDTTGNLLNVDKNTGIQQCKSLQSLIMNEVQEIRNVKGN